MGGVKSMFGNRNSKIRLGANKVIEVRKTSFLKNLHIKYI